LTTRRPSIAWRLAIGLTAFTALLWIGAAAIAVFVMQRELNAAYDENLRQSAMRLLPLAMHRLYEPEELDEFTGGDDDMGYVGYFIVGIDGRIIARVGDVPASLLSERIPTGYSTRDQHRIFSEEDDRGRFRIVVSEPLVHRTAALWGSLVTLTLPLAALIPIIAIGIWFAIRIAMRPVETLSREIATRDRRNLAPLSREGQPVELAPIADAVASLLRRLQAALDAERAFAASSAHELRTPIAGALAQTQQLALELGTRPGRQRVAEIESALRHLARLSEKLLQLARLEAGFAQAAVEADLMPVTRLVVRDYNARKPEKARIRIETPKQGELRAAIDADAFAIALRNLVENASLHGDPEVPVAVTVAADRTIHVINAGPIVPPETLARIGEPFVRGSTLADGTGLGLSIVRSIMQQAGGRLEVRSPAGRREDGFEAILLLP
jgi:two-component system OmpR family sensor kinase